MTATSSCHYRVLSSVLQLVRLCMRGGCAFYNDFSSPRFFLFACLLLFFILLRRGVLTDLVFSFVSFTLLFFTSYFSLVLQPLWEFYHFYHCPDLDFFFRARDFYLLFSLLYHQGGFLFGALFFCYFCLFSISNSSFCVINIPRQSAFDHS